MGTPIEDIDHAAIIRAVDDQVEESEVLDFTRELYRWQGSKQEKVEARGALAKDVAAFANRRGGVLVLGVADVDDRASKAMPASTAGRFDAWVRSTLAGRVAPVPDVEVVRLDDPDTAGVGFFLIVVPPSQQRPHAIYDPADKENAQRYPFRIGRETHWWTAAQVALEHARARERVQLRSARRDEVLGPAVAALGSRCWAAALVVPDVPGDMPITHERMRELQQHKAHLESMFGNARLPQTTRPIVGGFRQHSFAANEGAEIGGNLIDRYSDGSRIVAHELRVKDGDASGELPMLYTIDVLMWCLRTGFEHARQAGSYGLSTVSCSL